MSNPNLAAYYRLGDAVGSFQVLDSSGNNQTGSLIAGQNGVPTYGNTAAFIYDPNTSLDLTSGANTLSGGFSTVDQRTEPPTVHNPLGAATTFTVEMWVKWTGSTATPGTVIAVNATTANNSPILGQVSNLSNIQVGDAITGPNIPTGTTISGPLNVLSSSLILSANATGSGTGQYLITSGAIGSTLFSAAVPGGNLDFRVGAATSGSVTAYNRVVIGAYNPSTSNFTPVGNSNSSIVQNGSWHHIAVTASVASTTYSGNIYIDGVLDNPWSGSGFGAATGVTSITIGCDAGPLNGCVGMLQDVALYTTALTASQIANHFSIGTWFQSVEYGASVGGVNAGRLNKLLAVEGLNPSQVLNVPYPFRTALYAETNSVTTTSGLNYLQTMTETEGPGIIYQAPNGQITALSRQFAWLSPSTTTSQATFGDAASIQLHYDGPSFQVVQDDLDVWNLSQVQSGRSGELNVGSALASAFGLGSSGAVLQQASSPQSASVFGSRTLQGLTSLQMQLDSDALALAQFYNVTYSQPIRRVVSMQIDNYGGGGNSIPQILQRQIMDRITIIFNGQSPGVPFQADSVIEAITHTINMAQGPTWITQYSTSPYELLLTAMVFNNWTFGSSPAVLTL